MPIRDSAFTSPDALRLLYRNPRNALRETEDQNQAPTIQPAPEILPIDPGHECPAISEYILSCVGILRPVPQPIPVRVARKGMPLWNPIRETFSRIAHIEIVENVDCVRVDTFAGVSSIVSVSSMGIVHKSDTEGRRIYDLLTGPKDTPAGAVYWIMGNGPALECTIEKIYSAGKQTVAHITLEEEEGVAPIYASGTVPTKMLVWHNIKFDPDEEQPV